MDNKKDNKKTIPHDATVTINVESHTRALRQISYLGAIDMLNPLADRVEEMYWDEQERINELRK